jgi:hypothetical protein
LSEGATHTFIKPLTGAIQETHFPSGLSRAPRLTGLPNSADRKISGVFPTVIMGLVAGTSCELALMEAREQITPIIITDLDKGSV